MRAWLKQWGQTWLGGRSTPRRQPARRPARLGLERLEDRTVPTVTASLTGGVLTVTATGGNNSLGVSQQSFSVTRIGHDEARIDRTPVVTVAGSTLGTNNELYFTASQINKVIIRSLGADNIHLDPSLVKPTTVDMSAGTDVLFMDPSSLATLVGFGNRDTLSFSAADNVIKSAVAANGAVWSLQQDGDLWVSGVKEWQNKQDFGFDAQNRAILLDTAATGGSLVRSRLAFGSGGWDPMGVRVTKWTLTTDGTVYALKSNGHLLHEDALVTLSSPTGKSGGILDDSWDVAQPGYSASVTTNGGAGTWAVTGLPRGITALSSSGGLTLSGTPAATGYYGGTVTWTLQGVSWAKVSGQYELDIVTKPTFAPVANAQWTAGAGGYTKALTILGGTLPTGNLNVTGLPPGLTATLSGRTVTLAGTPSTVGTYPVSVAVQDAAGATASVTYNFVVNPPPTLGIISTAGGTANQKFLGTIAVTGGTPGFQIVSAVNLPPGLSATLNGTTISFAGTPTQAGTFGNVVLTLADAVGGRVSQTYSLTLAPAPTLTVGPATLPSEVAGQVYSAGIGATGGYGKYTYSLAAGSLPAGLALSSAGVISGSATHAGTYNFTVSAADNNASGPKGSQVVSLTVRAAPAQIVLSAPSTATAGSAFAASVTFQDRYGNPAADSVTLRNSDGGSQTVSLSGGIGHAYMTLTKAHSVTLAASAGRVSTSLAIAVNPGVMSNFTLTVSSGAVNVGSTIGVTVTAKDAWGNVATGYNGTVTVQSSDTASIPSMTVGVSHGYGSAALTAIHSGVVTLTAPGSTSNTVTIYPTLWTYEVTMTAYGWVDDEDGWQIYSVIAVRELTFTADPTSAAYILAQVHSAWTNELNDNEDPNGRWQLGEGVPVYDEHEQNRITISSHSTPAN